MAAIKGPARSRQREDYWRQIVTGQPASGLSIRKWCQRQKVTEASFYAWRRTLARRHVGRGATVKNYLGDLQARHCFQLIFYERNVVGDMSGNTLKKRPKCHGAIE
jgi:hypothetical protein